MPLHNPPAPTGAGDVVHFVTEWIAIEPFDDLFYARFQVGAQAVTVVLTRAKFYEGLKRGASAALGRAVDASAQTIVALLPPL